MQGFSEASGIGGGAPDPSASLFGVMTSEEDYSKGRAWIGQRRRRADIYAAARALLACSSFDRVQIQAIAEQCRLSPQTIYNLVGGKAEVMDQAAADWVDGIRVAALRRALPADVNAVFLILEMYWDSALDYSDFVRSASKVSSTPRDPLNRIFYRTANQALEEGLRRLSRAGALRAGADIESLARQLTAATHISICNWSAHPADALAYRRDLAIGPGAMLRAWLQGPELLKLERYMAAREGAILA